MSKPVLILVDDLFWKVRFQETAKGLGAQVVLLSNPDLLREKIEAEQPGLVIVDLALRKEPFTAISEISSQPKAPRMVGYFEHMRTDLWERGKQAGLARVFARSTLSEKLPALLRGEMGADEAPETHQH
jgi:hypothetical protein